MFPQLVLCLLIGVLSGVTAALCGVGGGIIMVPAFTTLLSMTQKNAAASSLAAIIITSLVATVKNSGNNLVDWKVVIPTALAAGVLAWFAADWLKSMSNVLLARIFGGLILVIGAKMLIMGK
jgi:uncharacterized membrane protein YfcA